MKNIITYILGATVLVGGAYLFLKNKKAKDLAELDKLGGTTPSGTTPSGTTPSGTTPTVTTPPITEPVKIDKDLNLDAFNLQKVLKELEEFEIYVKNATQKSSWDSSITPRYNTKQKDDLRKPYLEKLAKLGYKFDNGLLIKI